MEEEQMKETSVSLRSVDTYKHPHTHFQSPSLIDRPAHTHTHTHSQTQLNNGVEGAQSPAP